MLAEPILEYVVTEKRAMKVTYDQQTDTLSVVFREGAPIAESDEDEPSCTTSSTKSALGN